MNSLLFFHTFYNYRKSAYGKAYLFILASSGSWMLFHLLISVSTSAQMATYWSKYSAIAASLSSIALLRFTITYLWPRFFDARIKEVIMFLPTLLVAYASLTTDLITIGAEQKYWGYLLIRGPLYSFHSSYIALTTGAAIVLSILNLNKLTSLKKKQLSLFSLSFVIPLIAGIITEVISPIYNFELPPLTTSSFTFTALIISYAMSKYQFLRFTPKFALDVLVNTISDGFVAVDLQNQIVFSNNAFSNMTGSSSDELRGQNITKYIDEGLEKDLSTNKLPQKVSVKNKQSGIVGMFSTTQSKISNALGTRQGKIYVFHDISKVEKLAAELHKKAEEIEHSKKELEEKVTEAEKLNKLMVDRELVMVDLKNKLKNTQSSEANNSNASSQSSKPEMLS